MSLKFEVEFLTPFVISSGKALDGLDHTIDEETPFPSSAVKGLLRAHALHWLGVRKALVGEVFGTARKGSDWIFSDVAVERVGTGSLKHGVEPSLWNRVRVDENGRAEERARISREMHDSLAHRLSLVSLHAGALQTRTDLDMGSVRKIAGSIHTLAADSGRELRQILAVLHDDGSADGARATWSDVEEVLAHEREAGQEIDLHLAESWAESFEAADARSRHAVLRTIEELLTNARRHGAGGVVHLDCEVEASDGPGDDGAALVVRCVNDCPSTPRPTAPGGGLGLEGLRERLRLLGGELHVSQRTEQFIVMAAVPARGRAD